MKFKVDENLPPHVAEVLAAAGYDALTVGAQQLSGRADDDILAVCAAERRALVTLDLDFADLRYLDRASPGIIILRPRQQDRDSVVAIAARLVPILATRDVTGTLWIADDRRVRIREAGES